jgi:hypothetical protein
MKTAQDIIDTIGRERVMDLFGVKVRVIQHHLARGTLPADWYAGLCDLAGQDLPRHLFTFKGYGDAA